MQEDLLTPQEVAELLKIKKTTIYEMIKRGDLAASKLGKQLRISKNEVYRYLNLSEETSVLDNNICFSSNYSPSQRIINQQPVSYSASNDKNSKAEVFPIILCGQDSLLDILSNHINSNTFRPNVLRSYLGSYNGLYAMYQGEAQIATAHLWDSFTDTYNIPFISKLLPGMKVRVYHLISRMQGFYVRTGNPKKLQSFEDLARNDVVFVNREKGSGTRILLDSMLNVLSISHKQLQGYERVVNSHFTAATCVASGEADFALGTAKAGQQIETIEFIPLKEESYDLIIREEDSKNTIIKQIITTIQGSQFKKEIDLMGNYNTLDMGKRLL